MLNYLSLHSSSVRVVRKRLLLHPCMYNVPFAPMSLMCPACVHNRTRNCHSIQSDVTCTCLTRRTHILSETNWHREAALRVTASLERFKAHLKEELAWNLISKKGCPLHNITRKLLRSSACNATTIHALVWHPALHRFGF